MTLPNFLIVGVPKAGTTSLYKYLSQHPDVYVPKIKEPHYFSRNFILKCIPGPGDDIAMKDVCTTFTEYENCLTE
jgi:hypothetical protein